MAGANTEIEVLNDGQIVVIQEQGLRLASSGSPATRTWKIGRLSPEELNVLIGSVSSSGFASLDPNYVFPGRPIAGGGFTLGDMSLSIMVNLPELQKTVTAAAYISPDAYRSFSDMPAALNQVYSALAALIDKATVIATQNI